MIVKNMSKKYPTRNICIPIFFLLIFINCAYVNSNECKSNATLNKKKCFNQLYIFNHKKLKGGQFFTNKNGDLIIEYSDDERPNDRIFYGLKKDGGNYFQTENGFYEYTSEGITIDESANSVRKHNSMSYFVSIPDEGGNTEKEYFFTINPFKYLVELQELAGEGNNARYSWNLKDSIKFYENEFLTNETYLVEIKNKSEFFLTFNKKTTTDEERAFYVKNFRLKSFGENSYEEINFLKDNNRTRESYCDFFAIDREEIFGTVLLNRASANSNYFARFYEYNFHYIVDKGISGTNTFKTRMHQGNEFFKHVLLKENYLAVMLYTKTDEDDAGNIFRIAINQLINSNPNIDRIKRLFYEIKGINFNPIGTMSDFFKLDEKRACFISTEGNPEDSERKLYIYLFHFSDD